MTILNRTYNSTFIEALELTLGFFDCSTYEPAVTYRVNRIYAILTERRISLT
jgi:hypothetical protein